MFKRPFGRQKNWVRTLQERGPDLTFLFMVTDPCFLFVCLFFFFGGGGIDIYGPKSKKKTGPDQFFVLRQ